MNAYKVGDEVVVLFGGYGKGAQPMVHEATVTKVGRKWVHVRYRAWAGTEQFNAKTGAIKTEYSPRAFLYPNMQAYHDKVRLNAAWEEFARVSRSFYTCPDHLPAETLEAMTKTLRGEP